MIKKDKQTGLFYDSETYIVSESECSCKHVYINGEYLPCGQSNSKYGCHQKSYAGYHLQDVQDGTIYAERRKTDNEMMDEK